MGENLDITSPTSTTPINDQNLNLPLSLTPSNPLSFPCHNQILTKRDAQAIRRLETNLKGDLQRKAQDSNPVAPPSVGWNDGGFQGQFGNFVSHGKVSDSYQSIFGAGADSSDISSNSIHHESSASNKNHSNIFSNKFELVSRSTKAIKPSKKATLSNTICHKNGAPPNSDEDHNIISKVGKGETRKPPRPIRVMKQKELLFSHKMPCVSTTGNGPNGKTITGFLYKYTQREVRIVCVCHGSLFSPTEFVEHAGGVDVDNPLRHIRVDRFSFS